MNTTHNSESTRALGSLKKLATPVVLAGGLGLAVIGLGAGTANAGIAPTISCPNAVASETTFTAALAHWPVGTVRITQDSPSGPVIKTIDVDQTLAAPTTTSWYVGVPVPRSLTPGPGHQLYAQEPAGSQTLSAQCSYEIYVQG